MDINNRKPLASLPGYVILILLSFAISGCATMGSILQKNEHKFETTGLFTKQCKNCDKNKADLQRMVTAFDNIKESDEEKGIPGDSIDEVKIKGFTIYLDDKEKTRRSGTEILYGAEALAAVGMPLNPPQLNTPEAIEAYKKYMKAHFAWTFKETNLGGVVDRIYINTKNVEAAGSDYKFVITFKDNRVFRRVIKGGPQNTTSQEKAFLLGPGGFIGDILTGGVNRGIQLIK